MRTSLPEELQLEILKRLSPAPQVLARASAVCMEWRRLVNDPRFLHEIYRRGAPVTLGLFHNFDNHLPPRFVHANTGDPVRIVFEPVADPMISSRFMDCRHGRVLLFDPCGRFMVWHPMTGDHCYVQGKGVPVGLKRIQIRAALICECAAEGGGDESKCHVSHFRVAVVKTDYLPGSLHCSVYSLITGLWRKSADQLPERQIRPEHCVVMGKTLYQPLSDYLVLAFHTDTLNLTTFKRPKWGGVRLLKTDGGVLGLASVRGFTLRFWARHDDAWVMRKTVDISEMLGAPWPKTNPRFNFMSPVKIIGVTDRGEALFLWTMIDIFMLCLESMVLKKVCETTNNIKTVYPYGAIYLPLAARTQKVQLEFPHM
ncbi:unnamed protein product [Alopecurus aequalis]